MKIENNTNNYIQNIQNAKKQAANKSNNKQVEMPVDRNVEVTISEEAKRLSEVSLNEVRSKRVEDIKAAIQNGTYEINPKEITKGIMREINRQKGIEK